MNGEDRSGPAPRFIYVVIVVPIRRGRELQQTIHTKREPHRQSRGRGCPDSSATVGRQASPANGEAGPYECRVPVSSER
jgi:hypothetical protein